MRLWKTKMWSPVDIGCIKWSSILCGMIVGAFLPDFVKRYLWILIVAVVLLAVRPIAVYFHDSR